MFKPHDYEIAEGQNVKPFKAVQAVTGFYYVENGRGLNCAKNKLKAGRCL